MVGSIKEAIERKRELISLLEKEVRELEVLKIEQEKQIDEDHFKNPEPGDFWHDLFSPVLIVLEVLKDEIIVCDKTVDVYEPPREDMVLRSYESPEDPEVKRYFSLPRKCTGYTFDLEQARTISKSEFSSILKAYKEPIEDRLTYRCTPGRAKEFAEMWIAKNTKN